MYPIAEVDDVSMVFGDCGKIIPAMKDIPEEFKNYPAKNKWCRLFNDWFFSGVKNLKMVPKAGVDAPKAMRHIKTILGSFEPQHEHKEAAVAFLLSEWFEDATWERAK
jgi:hypothetical protein